MTALPPTRSAASDDGAPQILTGNKATARVLIVLTKLGEGAATYGVSELSRELGMTKNMVHRALSTLLRHGLVVRDPTGSRYQLGPGVLRLAGAGLPDLDLPQLCEPYMRRMRDLSAETVTLSVPSARMSVIVKGIRGRGVIARRVPLGRVIPLHVSPASRAMLAYFPQEAVTAYVKQPLQRFTRFTLTEPSAIESELAAVRERGYAETFGDHWRAGRAVAFPVLGSGSYPHGSITVAGPADRLTEDRLTALMPALEHEMAQLNRHSGLYASDYAGLEDAG